MLVTCDCSKVYPTAQVAQACCARCTEHVCLLRRRKDLELLNQHAELEKEVRERLEVDGMCSSVEVGASQWLRHERGVVL